MSSLSKFETMSQASNILTGSLWKSVWWLLRKLEVELPNDSALLLLGILIGLHVLPQK